MAILKNICGQHSMREMEANFNKETCIDTLRVMSGDQRLEEMPHYDTLNYYLEKLSPDCLAGLIKKMVSSLIRGKQFNRGQSEDAKKFFVTVQNKVCKGDVTVAKNYI